MPLENVGPPTAYSLEGWRKALICQLHSARADDEEVVEVVPPAISNPDGEVGHLLLVKVNDAKGRLAALTQSPEWQNARPYEPSRDSFFWAVEALCAQQPPSNERDGALLQLLGLYEEEHAQRWKIINTLTGLCNESPP
jgi:hypothetical protein